MSLKSKNLKIVNYNPTDLFIKSGETRYVTGPETKSKISIEGKKEVIGVRAITEIKDEKGNVLKKGVEKIASKKAVIAKPLIESSREFSTFSTTSDIALEVDRRLRKEGLTPLSPTPTLSESEYRGWPTTGRYSLSYRTKGNSRDTFQNAFKKVKSKFDYNKAGYELLLSKAIEEKKKEKAVKAELKKSLIEKLNKELKK